jgi:hypothetical protein
MPAATAVLAALFLAYEPGGITYPPGRFADVAIGQGENPTSLGADLANLSEIEPNMRRLQTRRDLIQTGKADVLEAGSISPLNQWEVIERTARRHKCSLDYFFGFGF